MLLSHPAPSNGEVNNPNTLLSPFFWDLRVCYLVWPIVFYLDAVNHTEDKCLGKDQAKQAIMQICEGLALEDGNSTDDETGKDESEDLDQDNQKLKGTRKEKKRDESASVCVNLC